MDIWESSKKLVGEGNGVFPKRPTRYFPKNRPINYKKVRGCKVL